MSRRISRLARKQKKENTFERKDQRNISEGLKDLNKCNSINRS